MFFVLLIFREQTNSFYDFKVQNYLMILLLLVAFIKYYKNFYRFVKWIICAFVGICLGINLVGWLITERYSFVGVKAMCENYYIFTLFISLALCFISKFVFNIKSKSCGYSTNKFIKKIEDHEKLYDSHKDDAKYICKFLFESNMRTLGISGRYGSGKTVIIKEIRRITESDKHIFIEITPLACSVEEIPTYIIGQIEKALKKNGIYTNNTMRIFNTIQNGYLSSLINIINDNQTLSDLYVNLHELIENLDIKLTIIVDDLDREYDNKQIKAIFVILDTIISDNCKVVYIYDSLALNNTFINEGGTKYIEKYIRDEYPLKELTFRDLSIIENNNYIEEHNTPQNKNISDMIINETNLIEFGTKIYKYSRDDLKFDKYKLTPRLVYKLIQMTYERLSDHDYLESIKGYERFVFRFYVFDYYFPDFKHQINGIKKPSLFFVFEYNGEKLNLEQVLARFFNVGVYDLKYPSEEEQYKEYMEFLHTGDNAEKLLALDLLGYSIDTFKSYIEYRNKIDIAELGATQNEIVYNRGYVNLAYDDAYNHKIFNNDKIASLITNLVNMSNSEYTDDEKFIKDFREKVLNKDNMLEALNCYKFEKYKDNQQTTDIIGWDRFTSIFNSFKKGNAKDVYWNDLMELYYKYLTKDDKIVFNDVVLININLFAFVSYRASIYAFMIISKFEFSNCENKYLDVASIPKIIELIKKFLDKYFGLTLVFSNPIQEKFISIDDIVECKKYLPSFKNDLQNFIKHLDSINVSFADVMENDLSYIRIALEKLIYLIDNANIYNDSIERNYEKTTFNSIPRDISKYKGKSKEEIDKLFDEDIEKNILRPIDYKRIMDEFNNE